MRCSSGRVSTVLVVLILADCWTIGAPRPVAAASSQLTVRDTPSELTLRCEDVIGSSSPRTKGYFVVSGRVALPSKALHAYDSGLPDPDARLFAKEGLLVKPGAAFELIVPDAWRGRLTIGWGGPATRTTRFIVAGCPSLGPQDQWLAFAGGYWVKRRACVPLIVKAAHKTSTVHVGVGAPCRGR
jgi:hypothetical protein